jgi:hypothetical protein
MKEKETNKRVDNFRGVIDGKTKEEGAKVFVFVCVCECELDREKQT